MQISNLEDLSISLKDKINTRLDKLNRLGSFTEDEVSFRLTKSGVIDLMEKYRPSRAVEVFFVVCQDSTEKKYVFHHIEFSKLPADASRLVIFS